MCYISTTDANHRPTPIKEYLGRTNASAGRGGAARRFKSLQANMSKAAKRAPLPFSKGVLGPLKADHERCGACHGSTSSDTPPKGQISCAGLFQTCPVRANSSKWLSQFSSHWELITATQKAAKPLLHSAFQLRAWSNLMNGYHSPNFAVKQA